MQLALAKKGVNRWTMVDDKHLPGQIWAFTGHPESQAGEGLAGQMIKLEKQKLSFVWNYKYVSTSTASICSA